MASAERSLTGTPADGLAGNSQNVDSSNQALTNGISPDQYTKGTTSNNDGNSVTESLNGGDARPRGDANTSDPLKSSNDDLPPVVPRDVRLLHLILASMGVTSYEDRVPLQLMDFAYRFTHGILQDALVYNDHAHSSMTSAGLGGTQKPLTTDDVRLAIAARLNYQFKPAPPKEMLLELAQEKNRRPLPVVQELMGLRLPPEKYCLTAKEWNFDEEKEIIQKKKRVKTDDDVVMSG